MGAGISISPSGQVIRKPVAASLLSPAQLRAEALIARRHESDPEATMAMLRNLQMALSVKVSLVQIYARSEWRLKDSTDGTMRKYFEYVGAPKGMEDAANLLLPPPPEGKVRPKPGAREWKRQRSFGPEWDGEAMLDAGWNLVFAHVVLDDALEPARANRYGRALVGAMIDFLSNRTALAGTTVFQLVQSEDWSKLESLVRSDPSVVVDAWDHRSGSESHGLSVLQHCIVRGASPQVLRLVISAWPQAVDERTRASGPAGSACLPLWQACRDFDLSGHKIKRRSTDPARPGPLAVQREVYVANPFQCRTRGPDRVVPLEEASKAFLFDRRVVRTIARAQCPRLARRAVGGSIPLEAAVEVDGVPIEDVTQLVWLFPAGVNHRVASTRRVGSPNGEMLIGVVLERALYEHRVQSESLPPGTISLNFSAVDPRVARVQHSNHVADKHEQQKSAQEAAAVLKAVPTACLGNYVVAVEAAQPGSPKGQQTKRNLMLPARRKPLMYNRHPVYVQYFGVSSSEQRRKNKTHAREPHFIFMSSTRRCWVVATKVGQEKGHLLRMSEAAPSTHSSSPAGSAAAAIPTNATDGSGAELPAPMWQVFAPGGWKDAPSVASWVAETKMAKLHRLLNEALTAGQFDAAGVRAIQAKLAHSSGGLDEHIQAVQKRLASLRSLPSLTQAESLELSARYQGATKAPSARRTVTVSNTQSKDIVGSQAETGQQGYPKRYRQLLEVIAKIHPDGWLQYAQERPKHALKLVQCKLDEGEVLAVHKMMSALRPKAPLEKLCNCQPCSDQRAKERLAAERKAQEERINKQLTEMRNQSGGGGRGSPHN